MSQNTQYFFLMASVRGRQKQSAKLQQQQQHIRMSVSEEGDPTKDPRKQQQNLLCCCFVNFEGMSYSLFSHSKLITDHDNLRLF